MDNKVEALLAISDKANERFKYLLFYTPQDVGKCCNTSYI